MTTDDHSIPLGTMGQPFDVEDAAAERVLVENIRKVLETQPFTVLNVHPRPDDPSMCPVVHSIGLGRHGFPEIIVGAALDIEIMAAMVANIAGEWMDAGKAEMGVFTSEFFQNSDDVQLPWAIRYIDSEALADQAAVSVLKTYYGAMPAMAQLILSSPQGILPYEEGYSQAQHFQPLLKEMELPSEKKH